MGEYLMNRKMLPIRTCRSLPGGESERFSKGRAFPVYGSFRTSERARRLQIPFYILVHEKLFA